MSEIIHKTEPVEHWIVDGKAYRLATEADVGKPVLVTDYEMAKRKCPPEVERSLTGVDSSVYPFKSGGNAWRYAYIQDDSLLQPQAESDLVEFEVKRTAVPELGDGWYQLTAEDGVIKKGDRVSLIKGQWTEIDGANGLRGRDIGDSMKHGMLIARDFSQPKMQHVVDCVTVEQRIAERTMEDKAMKQAEATVANWAVVPATKPIDWTKPVRTKDGRAVRVLCADGPGDYPVIGLVNGDWRVCSWTLDGIQNMGTTGPCDLENTPQRLKKKWWMNVFDDGSFDYYETKEAADNDRGRGIFACVPFPIDCEEGEGL